MGDRRHAGTQAHRLDPTAAERDELRCAVQLGRGDALRPACGEQPAVDEALRERERASPRDRVEDGVGGR
eukprot:3008951-Prymnesium_polylepis.1